jgi:peptide/nickel transport system substrate-binding protein
MGDVRRSLRAVGLAVLALGLFAASCGDDGGDSGAPESGATGVSTSIATTTTATPKAGGSLTIAIQAESPGLDPVVSNIPGGGTAGMELVALYDTLMRYDPAKGQFEPRLAQSLTSNADLTVWTLKLRSNIKFTDGTPLDAAAVIANFKRHVEKKSRSGSALLAEVSDYAAPDATTVVLTLKASWAGMPFALSTAPGMIVSPTAVAKLGDGLPKNPVGAGAGPFVIDSFKPGESVVMKKNPAYWGGQVLLDELRFVPMPMAPLAYASLQQGGVQVAYFRDPSVIAQATDAGFPATKLKASAGSTLLMNNGVKVACAGGQPSPICTGQAEGALVATKSPTSDKRVRQAVAASIDLNALNTRVYSGKAEVGSELIAKGTKWYDGVAGPAYDAALAKKLVTEVKAEGQWDGSIRLACHSALPDFGIAVKTMLEANGFKVTVKDNQNIQAMIADVIVKKDFDLSCFGTTIQDEYPYSALNRDFNSGFTASAGNWVGYVNPAVDAALKSLSSAANDAAAKAAITTVAKAFTADVPFLALGPSTEIVTWQKNIQGIYPTLSAMVYFDKAWIG